MTGPLATGTLGLDSDELVSCVGCGLCLPHCPTYRVTGLEFASPRGRIAAMRAVESGEAAVDAEFVRAMEECVQCRGCEAACPSSVPFGHLMEGTREAIHDAPAARPSLPQRAVEWVGYRIVLPRHAVLLALTWLLLVGQRLHLVPRRFGVPTLSRRDLRATLLADPEPEVTLFTGCVMDAWQRPVHQAALEVMRATGTRVGLPGPGAACCGALHAHAGRIDEARTLARRVMAAVPATGPIVVDSAGCGAAMKDYGHLAGTDAARAFAARVVDFSEWVVARGVPTVRATQQVVVVQDPCHLRHVQHADAAVRTLLGNAYDVRATGDDGLCCGAGGAYSMLQPELAGEIRDRKVDAIRRARGEPATTVLVASANPGCAMHLGAVDGLEVRHPAVLIRDALTTDGSTGGR